LGLLGIVLTLARCGEEPMLILDLDTASVPASTASLRVLSALNGDVGQTALIEGEQRHLVVYLPPDASGEIQLKLEALDPHGCQLALSILTEPVPGGLARYVEQAVALTPLPRPQCPR
jgi:hypothetical protein